MIRGHVLRLAFRGVLSEVDVAFVIVGTGTTTKQDIRQAQFRHVLVRRLIHYIDDKNANEACSIELLLMQFLLLSKESEKKLLLNYCFCYQSWARVSSSKTTFVHRYRTLWVPRYLFPRGCTGEISPPLLRKTSNNPTPINDFDRASI
jgi:hypothetical protein